MKTLVQWLIVSLQVALMFVVVWVSDSVKQQNALLEASRQWPTTEALVLDFDLHSHAHSHAVTPSIHYRYVVEGEVYEHTRLKFDDMPVTQKHAITLKSQYPGGEVVRVYYDPKMPKNATLMPASNAMISDGKAVLGILHLITLSIFFCLLATLHNQRKQAAREEAEQPAKPQFYFEA